ncbi:molybdopterin molybdotransferase MoeA [Hippea jasoniae]|uniref:molybdopterin molybdotransferase MoeA n=1 Tax=Hippea jasoniae TaxID=944479 RepID=UPI000A44050E|nr:molybdopterin molybdotransferase MoeA [Hippea jasoniae]
MKSMIKPKEALNIILEQIKPVGCEEVSIFEANRRVCCKKLISNKNLPPLDDAAMDGYAVRFEDIKNPPVTLKILGVIKAGDDVSGKKIEKGSCYRIMTGAFLPEGADTVVEFEATRQLDENSVEILKEKKKNANVRFKGEDIKENEEIDFTGEILTPYKLSRLVSTNNIFVNVYKKPSVCIISTGDELDKLGSCKKHSIIDSNAFFLKSFLKQELDIDAAYLGISKDSKDDLIKLLDEASRYDVIITTAGISFGDFDVVTNVEKQIGINWLFKYVQQKPGKPFAFGTLKNSFIFSFPGNPVSTTFCSFFYLLPALKKMMGFKRYMHKTFRAKLTKDVKKSNDRVHFNRVTIKYKDGEFFAEPFQIQGSNIIRSISTCNGFAMIGSDRVGIIKKGEMVDVIVYDSCSFLAY